MLLAIYYSEYLVNKISTVNVSLSPSLCTGSGENLMLHAVYYSEFFVNKMGTVNLIIVALLMYGVR